jgi:hypothetical protein
MVVSHLRPDRQQGGDVLVEGRVNCEDGCRGSYPSSHCGRHLANRGPACARAGLPRQSPGADAGALRGAAGAALDSHTRPDSAELITAIGHEFHRDYGVVLRALLFVVDRHRARQVTGIPAEEWRP